MKALMISITILAMGSGAALASSHQAPVRSAVPLVVRPSWRPRAAVVLVPLDPLGRVVIQTPVAVVDTPEEPAVLRIPHYQNPDGSYDSLADLTNAINGVPCGVECTARSLARWGYRP